MLVNQLSRAVQNAKVSTKNGASFNLDGRMLDVPSGNATVISKFYYPTSTTTNDFNVCVVLHQVSGTDYRVYVAAGTVTFISRWIYGE